MPVFFTNKNGVTFKVDVSVEDTYYNLDPVAYMRDLLEKVPAGEIISGPEIRRYEYGWRAPNVPGSRKKKAR